MSDFRRRYGPVALVTGASSGIGAEFCRQLAARGLDLVTVARRSDVLERQAQALHAEFGVKVTSVRADLTDSTAIDGLLKTVAGIEIGLLVANAGVGQLGRFTGHPIRSAVDVVNVNVTAPMVLAHHFSSGMAERGRGGIILTGSTLGFYGVPYMGVYAATKAFVHSFGEALNGEMTGTGVDVCVLVPGPTDTPMIASFDMSKFPVKAMAVAPVVTKALESLGRKPLAIPGMMNNIMSVVGKRVMSRKAMTHMLGSMMEQMSPRE